MGVTRAVCGGRDLHGCDKGSVGVPKLPPPKTRRKKNESEQSLSREVEYMPEGRSRNVRKFGMKTLWLPCLQNNRRLVA